MHKKRFWIHPQLLDRIQRENPHTGRDRNAAFTHWARFRGRMQNFSKPNSGFKFPSLAAVVAAWPSCIATRARSRPSPRRVLTICTQFTRECAAAEIADEREGKKVPCFSMHGVAPEEKKFLQLTVRRAAITAPALQSASGSLRPNRLHYPGLAEELCSVFSVLATECESVRCSSQQAESCSWNARRKQWRGISRLEVCGMSFQQSHFKEKGERICFIHRPKRHKWIAEMRYNTISLKMKKTDGKHSAKPRLLLWWKRILKIFHTTSTISKLSTNNISIQVNHMIYLFWIGQCNQ